MYSRLAVFVPHIGRIAQNGCAQIGRIAQNGRVLAGADQAVRARQEATQSPDLVVRDASHAHRRTAGRPTAATSAPGLGAPLPRLPALEMALGIAECLPVGSAMRQARGILGGHSGEQSACADVHNRPADLR